MSGELREIFEKLMAARAAGDEYGISFWTGCLMGFAARLEQSNGELHGHLEVLIARLERSYDERFRALEGRPVSIEPVLVPGARREEG